MKRHLRKIIKQKNEYFYLLTLIERFLKKIRHEYRIWKIDELEDHLLKEVEKDDKSFAKHHLKFIRIVKQFLEAFNLAYMAHKDQKRADGEKYIIHPIQVALNEIYHQENESHFFDEKTIDAALLHDTVEDTNIDIQDIFDGFGRQIGEIVENVTDNPEWADWFQNGNISKLEEAALQFVNANKLEESMSVKFDDRKNNLETLSAMPEGKAVQKVMDTISVGYIERAADLKEFEFLKTLNKAIERYLSPEIIKNYYNGDPVITKLAKHSAKKIKDILNKNNLKI